MITRRKAIVFTQTYRSILAFIVLLLCVSAPIRAEWRSGGTLKIPEFFYTFLSVTPDGHLLAAAFNRTDKKASVPALLIKNPTSTQPEVVELIRLDFEKLRGFGGIVSDASGGFFVSADTGDRFTSFIRKFKADGQPDPSFAGGGELRFGRRMLGLELAEGVLLVAVDWGEIMRINPTTGAQMGLIPVKVPAAFVRDIAIDPKSYRIFGVAQGGIQMWAGGSPTIPEPYRWEPFSPPKGEPNAAEGISLDPFKRCVLITPHPGNKLIEVYGNRGTIETVIASANEGSHLVDTALSFDGTTLFVSDFARQRIHLLQRQLVEEQVALVPPPPASGAGLGAADAVKPVPWETSFEVAMKRARELKKPLVVYFRRPGMKKCEEFEKAVLRGNEFNQRAANYICVFVDGLKDRLLAYRMGVVRVPHVMILEHGGETRAEFSGQIDAKRLFDALAAGPTQ
jgi:hypothetical protein